MKDTVTIKAFDKTQRNAEEFAALLIQMRTMLREHGDFLRKSDDDQGTLAELYQSVVERVVESKLTLLLPTNTWMSLFTELLLYIVPKEVKE